MSRKERERLTVMAGVKRQELTLVQGAEPMGLGYRQTKRVWRRYQTEGDAGLVHRLRGQPTFSVKPTHAEPCPQAHGQAGQELVRRLPPL